MVNRMFDSFVWFHCEKVMWMSIVSAAQRTWDEKCRLRLKGLWFIVKNNNYSRCVTFLLLAADVNLKDNFCHLRPKIVLNRTVRDHERYYILHIFTREPTLTDFTTVNAGFGSHINYCTWYCGTLTTSQRTELWHEQHRPRFHTHTIHSSFQVLTWCREKRLWSHYAVCSASPYNPLQT